MEQGIPLDSGRRSVETGPDQRNIKFNVCSRCRGLLWSWRGAGCVAEFPAIRKRGESRQPLHQGHTTAVKFKDQASKNGLAL